MSVRRITGRWVARIALRGTVAMTAAGAGADYHSDYVDMRGQLPRREGAEYATRSEDLIEGLVFHHTATTAQGWSSVAAYHADRKRWPEIAYPFGIDYRGVKYHLLDVTKVSYHASGYNRRAIAIALLGNYHERPMTEEMKAAALDMQYELAERYDLKWSCLHNETKATACPGRYATEFLKPYLFGPRPRR